MADNKIQKKRRTPKVHHVGGGAFLPKKILKQKKAKALKLLSRS
jgi:hypothetical protein